MGSRFQVVQQGPPIEVFQLNRMFMEDPHPSKINLSIGAYRDEKGQPWVLPVVRKMEKQMANDETLLHEYLPVLGMEQFSAASTAMLLGEDSPAIASGRARAIDFEGLIEDLRNAPENSVILLHACAHNPTGYDPTHEQWEKIADVMEERKLFPFFDSAYQGFASGDLDQDAWAVRYFVKRGFELICAQSYAKNFGLYNERVGNLAIVVSDPSVVQAMRSQLTWIVRGMYSNPPAHGARVVTNVLTNKQLFDEWKDHIKAMSSRVTEMREALRAELIK
ncbi:hypothetical protein HF086_008290 [Spodoptera exigua]|uniref:Aspartate aminotransferase n=1 Tax=Spodoptera exigua TaxID=7107 RepID=A0A922SE72_SPOEX|nr:hypothetical protein HF086_008290 [Spodoptera exigua]